MARSSNRWFAARSVGALRAAIAVTALACAGCGSQCDRHPDDPPVVWDGGTTLHGLYTSAPPGGPFLDFPPGRTYRFENDLGGVPARIDVSFSFNPWPFDGGANSAGSVAAAGNQATIQQKCAKYFDVRNDTCSEVYLWVSAADPIPGARCESDGPADAGVRRGPADASQNDARPRISDAASDVSP